MGASYHQFCPVSKAMEVLDQRWTMLVMRELLSGSRHFNQMRRGLITMSPALLSKRLQQLERAGLVSRRTGEGVVEYWPTEAGEELRPIVTALGEWAVRWVGELGDADLDPKLLMWDWQTLVDRRTLPVTRTVVCFRFPEQPPKQRFWWMLVGPDDVDVCDIDPGHGVEVSVCGPLRALVEVWRGDQTWAQVLRSGAVTMTGPSELRRAVPTWFRPSKYAAVPRPLAAAPH